MQMSENSRKHAYKQGQVFVLAKGQSVVCNGAIGVVCAVLDGQLTGMVEVRLERGVVCVSSSFPDCFPLPPERFIVEKMEASTKPWKVHDTYASECEDPVFYSFSSQKKAEAFKAEMIIEHGNW